MHAHQLKHFSIYQGNKREKEHHPYSDHIAALDLFLQLNGYKKTKVGTSFQEKDDQLVEKFQSLRARNDALETQILNNISW